MSLNVGSRFAHYHVTAFIGEGGMGQVYRATDTKLNRDVALKMLPAPSAGSAERLARFQREAQVLASLNHPNIATIHGIEEVDGTIALVMELVEGPTLAESVARAPLPLDEALAVARQLTDALEAAHDQGIVHRDLKPANIKVRPDGTVKVLDFGLAKLIQAGGEGQAATVSQSPTITSPAMTRAGIILGTAAYMSPEQARGKAVDTRADIWAFGCVLYEMLTGGRAFPGEDITETLAAVVKTEPNWDLLQKSVPSRVRQALRVCLQKDPRQRAKDIHDVRLVLDGAFEDDQGDSSSAGVKRTRRWPPSAYAAIALLTVLLAAFGFVSWGRSPVSEGLQVTKFVHDLLPNQTPRNIGRAIFTLSRNGDYFIYNSVQGLILRRLDELEARLIPGTGVDLTNPFLSPDGQWIAYWERSAGQIKRIPVNGGPPVTIGPATNPLGASWEADNMILVGQQEGIVRMAAAGGTPELVVPARDGEVLSHPQLLPGGDLVLFSALRPQTALRSDAADIVVQSMSSGERTVLLQGGGDARYVPPGHLVYALEDSLFVVRFDVKRLRTVGGSVPVIEGVMRSNSGSANYGVADDGTLAYLSGADAGLRELVWVDRWGGEVPIGAPLRSYVYAQLSPDGTRVALDIRDEESDIWIWDLQRQSLQRLTSDPGPNRGVAWSPDGQRVAFSREGNDKQEVVWQQADGSGSPEPLTDGSPMPVMPSAFSADGATLFYHSSGPPFDMWMIPVGGSPTAGVSLFQGPSLEVGGTLSPDGLWFAYESNESGRPEVYVRPFPAVHTARWQISTEGGRKPLWSRDGRELFYQARTGLFSAIVSVAIDTRTGFVVSSPTTLFENRYATGNAGRQVYDVSPDGQRFLMIKPVVDENARQGRVIVVRNWLEELKRQVPTN